MVFMGLRRSGVHCSAVHLPHLRQDLATACSLVGCRKMGVREKWESGPYFLSPR